MTPLTLEVLLHYYYTGGLEFPRYKLGAPAVDDTVEWAANNGLIARDHQDAIYQRTQKLVVYVEEILRVAGEVPLPYWTCARKEA